MFLKSGHYSLFSFYLLYTSTHQRRFTRSTERSTLLIVRLTKPRNPGISLHFRPATQASYETKDKTGPEINTFSHILQGKPLFRQFPFLTVVTVVRLLSPCFAIDCTVCMPHTG